MSITLFAYDPTLTVAGLGGTFTRADASTCATYVDSNGVVQTVAANVLRNSHYVNGVRTTLLEGSRTNGCKDSGDISTANWSAVAGVTSRTLNAVGPTGAANSANTLTASGANVEVQQITATALGAGATAVVSGHFKLGSGAAFGWVGDQGDAVNHRAWINLSTGAVSGADAGVTGTAVNIGNGWYRLSAKYTTTNAYNQRINCGHSRTSGATDSQAGDTALVSCMQPEGANAFMSSYIATGAAAVTRAADALSFPFLPVPQAMTVYADCYDLGTYATSNGGIGSVGGTTGASLQFYSNGSGIYNTFHSNGSTSVTKATGAAATFSDRVELRFPVQSDGSVLIGQSLNSGTETVSTTSAANTFASAWNATTVFVGQMSAGGFTGFAAFRSLKIASGVQSLATMRTLTATSGVVSATLAPSSVVAEGAWYAQPAYTVLDTGTATALQASAIPTNTNQQVRVLRLDVTCSAAPAAGTIVNIQDGGTVLWQGVLSAGSRKLTVDFTRKPLRGSRGATVTAEMASAGGSVVQTIVMTCDTVRAP